MKTIDLIGDLRESAIGAVSGGWQTTAAGPRYVVKSGDTLGKLAARYLSASRVSELWQLQPWRSDARHGNDMNRLYVGDVLTFPADGVARARQLGELAGEAEPLLNLTSPFGPAVSVTLPGFGGTIAKEIPSMATPAFIPASLPLPQVDPSSNGGVRDFGEADQWQLTDAEKASKARTELGYAVKKYATWAAFAAVGLGAVVYGKRFAEERGLLGGGGGGGGGYMVQLGNGRNAQTMGPFRTFEQAYAAAPPGARVLHPQGG